MNSWFESSREGACVVVQFKREVVSLQAIIECASIVFGRYADAELLSEREIRAESRELTKLNKYKGRACFHTLCDISIKERACFHTLRDPLANADFK